MPGMQIQEVMTPEISVEPHLQGPAAKFHEECLELLAHQERIIQEMNSTRDARPMTAVLEHAVRLLAALTEFAQERFDDADFGAVTGKLYPVYVQTRDLAWQADLHCWSRATRRGGWEKSGAEIHRLYQKLGGRFTSLHQEFFTICAARLGSDGQPTSGLRQRLAALLTELEHTWQKWDGLIP